MDQAPGTHWYHSHKHGSTALNLFNGLSGALIIADDSAEGYDGKLKAFYGKDFKEKVLVIQQISEVLNMATVPKGRSVPPLIVNGQLTPTITMETGEVQLWRIINASVQGFVPISFSREDDDADKPQMAYKQTAQDGVQLAWENYADKDNGTRPLDMAPANRVDLLVQAPDAPGDFKLGELLKIKVESKPTPNKMGFPEKETDYPRLPRFLADIDPSTVRLRREVTFGSRAAADKDRRKLQFTIDDKQFADHKIDQMMLLNSAEEWTVYNADTNTRIKHPFHIHINPFQIVEVFDPSQSLQPMRFEQHALWWDTFAIPAPVQLKAGQTCPSKVVEAGGAKWCVGYFKMRTRFVDFTGQYVQHCHILAHEDRGMMQLLEVVSDQTALEHH